MVCKLPVLLASQAMLVWAVCLCLLRPCGFCGLHAATVMQAVCFICYIRCPYLQLQVAQLHGCNHSRNKNYRRSTAQAESITSLQPYLFGVCKGVFDWIVEGWLGHRSSACERGLCQGSSDQSLPTLGSSAGGDFSKNPAGHQCKQPNNKFRNISTGL